MQIQKRILIPSILLILIFIIAIHIYSITPRQIKPEPNLIEELEIPVGNTGNKCRITPLELGYFYENDQYLTKINDFNSETSFLRRFYLYWFCNLKQKQSVSYSKSEMQDRIIKSLNIQPTQYKIGYDWDSDEILYTPSVPGTTYSFYCPKEYNKEKIRINAASETPYWDMRNPVILGEATTQYSGELSLNRNINMKVASEKINGTIVNPTEIYSMYNTISPFTEKEGYTEAGVIVGNEYSQALGGGVCQVTTTMYNAVLRAELDVIERHNHSTMVNYVAPGFDATIAGEYVDFKFKNQTEHPVAIFMNVSNGSIRCVIVGQQPEQERNISFNTTYENGTYTLYKYVDGKKDSIINKSKYKEE